MQPTHAELLDWIVVVLLLLQFLAWSIQLRRWYRSLSRARFIAVVAPFALLWAVSLFGFWLTWSGRMYSGNFMAVGLRATIVALGYFWLILSTLGMAFVFTWRFAAAKIPRLDSGPTSASRRAWVRSAALLAVSSPAAAVGFGAFIGRNQFRTLELDFPVPDLHPDLEGFRIVQVSDLHVSPFLSPAEAARVIDAANELHADLAVFTGDLISERGDPLDEAIRELIRLRSSEGVLGCMGNHEHYAGCRNYLESQAGRAGVRFLRGTASRIQRGGATLNVVGVDFQRGAERLNYLAGTENLIVPGAANLLLSHNPDVFPTAAKRGFQAVLSGHTHGGQVNVEILHRNVNPARFRTPFTSGLYRLPQDGAAQSASCFVTNGIGTIGIPIRLGAPPEIALLRLRRA